MTATLTHPLPAWPATAEWAAAILWETRQFSTPGRTTPTGRVSPRAAYQLLLFGRAMPVDIRPEGQRRTDGQVDPALRPLHVERHQLTERLAGWATPQAHVLVLCQEGYASPLAAASLAELRVRASDVVGGLRAWREAGLPVTV